jgi:hypothetical protein
VVLKFVEDFVNEHIKNVGGLSLAYSPNLFNAESFLLFVWFAHGDGARRIHPVEWFVRSRVAVNKDRAVAFEHEKSGGER